MATQNRFKNMTESISSNRFKNLDASPTQEVPFESTKLGIAANTIKGLLGWVPPEDNPYLQVAKNIGQGTARTVASVGITAGNIPTQIANSVASERNKIPLPFDQSIDTSGNKITRAVFGGKPINTVQQTAKNVKEYIKPYVGETTSGLASYPLVALGIALDLSGFGGGKSVKMASEIPEAFFKIVTKDKNVVSQYNRLLQIGMAENDAKALSKVLAETKTIDETKNIIKNWKPGSVAEPVRPAPGAPEKPLFIGEQKPSTTIPRAGAVTVSNTTPDAIKVASDARKARLESEGWLSTKAAEAPVSAAQTQSIPAPVVTQQTPSTSQAKPVFNGTSEIVPSEIDTLMEQKAHIEMLMEINDDLIKETGGAELSKFKSRKEGSFLDQTQVNNKMTNRQKDQIIKRNIRLGHVAQNAGLAENFDDPDMIRDRIEKYDALKEQQANYKAQRAELNKRIAEAKKQAKLSKPAKMSKAELQSLDEIAQQKEIYAVPQEQIEQPARVIEIPQAVKGDIQKENIYRNSIQQKILDARQAANLFGDYVTVDPNIAELDHPIQRQEVRDLGAQLRFPQKITEDAYKDITTVKKQLRDIYRNSEEVFRKDWPAVKEAIFDPMDASKGNFVKTLELELADFKDAIAGKFKENSAADKAVQLYGEKKMSYEDLISQFGKEQAAEIVKAEQWYRHKYELFIDNINRIEQEIYPNHPEKWTPKRADYFRHYQESTSEFSRLQNILENPVRIDPMLEGISEGTTPKTKWASIKQMRMGDKTKVGAMRGFLDYLPGYSYAINIDQHIGKFRELAELLGRVDHKSKKLNNYIYNLQMYANSLAGKSSEIDRVTADLISRRGLQVVDWVNRRAKANTILGNFSSSISQFLNIPQGVATAGPVNFLKGIGTTLAQTFGRNVAMENSTFIKERYFKGFSEFDHGMLNNTKKLLGWMVTVGDEIGTKMIWNSMYEMAKTKGITDAKSLIKFADDATRKLVGGRGVGEKSLVQNSKMFQVVAPFQLEVTNLWWVMEDLAKSDNSLKKKFGQFATLFFGLWMANNIIEKINGNRPVFDPAQAVIDSAQALKNENYALAGGRIFGEVLSNVPFGQSIASIYPEFGTSMFGKKLPTRKALFGRSDPTRFGESAIVIKALSDPLYKLLLPFGGSQIKKTKEGIKSYNQKKSTTSVGSFQYKIDQTPANLLKATLFGKGATTNAQEYYEKRDAKATGTTKSTNNRFKGL